MKAPTSIRTDRLLLRKPEAEDADSIFERYASDPVVCHYLAWPMHRSRGDTRAFIEFSESEWRRWPAGPYLILSLADKQLLGGTGLGFETPACASAGYVLAKDAWGKGFATEALIAMRGLASGLAVTRLYAYCHPGHRASRRVLEKAGFELEGTILGQLEFPNMECGAAQDVVCYAIPNLAAFGNAPDTS